jgi:phosphatidylglycerophosphate synthase
MAVESPEQAVRADIEATYKAREIEGFLDLHFYRRVGFRLARLFARAGVTPNAVTLLGTVAGIVAGHLYFYRDLKTNLAGMVLHVFANTMDNVDGQLARLTNRQSPSGRILDGIGDNLVFGSVYLHLCLRFVAEGGSSGIWVIGLLAAASHSVQSAAAEFCRDAYLRFGVGKLRAFDLSSDLRPQYESLTWSKDFLKKVLLRVHLNYVVEQEMFCPGFVHLEEAARTAFPGGLPGLFRERYRERSRQMIRLLNFFRTNSRMCLLFLLLFLGRPIWYFSVELIPLNLFLVVLLLRQNAICRQMEQLVTEHVSD